MEISLPNIQTIPSADLVRFIDTIKQSIGFDFNGYSQNSLMRRINRILSDYSYTIDQLISKLENDSIFTKEVINKITVNTTEFFRNPHIWMNMYKHILKELQHKDEVYIWIAGCSTGEEVYSLVMILYDMGVLNKCHIVATDLNNIMLDKAAKGIYKYEKSREQLADYYRILNYINKNDDLLMSSSNHFNINIVTKAMQFVPALRYKPVFIQHDLGTMQAPVFKKFDLIICRNVMIYFTSAQQIKINEFFYELLNNNSFMVLGKDEMIVGQLSQKYQKHSLFYKKQ